MDFFELLAILLTVGLPLAAVAIFVACIVTLVRAKRHGASRAKVAAAVVGLVLSGIVVAFLVCILVFIVLIVAGVIPFM